MSTAEIPDHVRKVRKLLDKAASTPFGEERDALIATAERLSIKHSITEVMLADAAPARSERPVEELVDLPTRYSKEYGYLFDVVARHGFKVEVVLKTSGYNSRGFSAAAAIGFKDDIAAAKRLWNFLATTEMAPVLDGPGSVTVKKNWVHGFCFTVGTRLKEERKQAEEEVEETTHGTALVLADRNALVNDELRKLYPRTRSVTTRAQYSWSAQQRGVEAANSADLSTRERITA